MKQLNFDHEPKAKHPKSMGTLREKKRIVALTYEKGDHARMYVKKGDK